MRTGWPRVAGLLVDWLIAGGLAMAFFGGFNSPHLGTAQMGVWFVMGIFAVTLFGFTPGQLVIGMRVARVDYGVERNTAEATGEQSPAAVGIVSAFSSSIALLLSAISVINDGRSSGWMLAMISSAGKPPAARTGCSR